MLIRSSLLLNHYAMAYPDSTAANDLEDYHLPYHQSSVTSSEDHIYSAIGLRTITNSNANSNVSTTLGSTIAAPNLPSTQRTMASRSSMSQQSHPYQQQQQQQQQFYPVQQQLSAQRPSTAGDRIGSTRRFTTNTVPPMPVVSQLTTEPQQRRNVNDTSSDLSSAVSFDFHLDYFSLFCIYSGKIFESGKTVFRRLIHMQSQLDVYLSNSTCLHLIILQRISADYLFLKISDFS